ncbi:flap endonuclease-1 [Candidatus Woesearchaeota archaeon]|nr:MAG: flap endonuclease-1 [Candidatus Woesearchaeota archaeon]
MGVAIVDLLKTRELNFNDLKNKVVAIDAFNVLYQFLTTIRQADGTLLKDSNGNITSHIVGLFARTTNLMSKGIKLVFVFDGETPDLKKQERERRIELKKEAKKKYEIAKQREDIEDMKKYASRTTKLTPEMVNEAKELLSALGLPIVQAPSEGEAQASYMVRQGDVYATVSQDIDSLLFGSPRLIRNLTISSRRKLAGRLSYTAVKPEIISLTDTLNELGIDQKQLIVLGMLVGTDFNVGGIKGIGPKKALALVREHKHDFDTLFKEAKWDEFFDFSWEIVYDFFENVPVTEDYKLEWNMPDVDRLKRLLVDGFEFSEERVDNTLAKFLKEKEKHQQKGLNEFF